MTKKILIALAFIAFVAGFAVAQDAIVQKVTGRVEFEASPGKWEVVKVGQKLAPTAVINTKLNASLVLKIGDKLVTIKAMQKGTVAKLSSDKLAAGDTGAIKAGEVKQSSIAVNDTAGNSNISTASTRAAEVTNDTEWVE
jgi:hypothetical protein